MRRKRADKAEVFAQIEAETALLTKALGKPRTKEEWHVLAEDRVARARAGDRHAQKAVLRRFAADKANADPLVIEYAAEVMERLLDPDTDPAAIKLYRETPTETRDKSILRHHELGMTVADIAKLFFPDDENGAAPELIKKVIQRKR